jgi:outer membrane protein assembly factor BamB
VRLVRFGRASRARIVPLAVLASIVALLSVARVRSPGREGRAVTGENDRGASSTASAPRVGRLEGTLAATTPSDAVSVASGPPNMIHEDPRHTHRAHGHVPRDVQVEWKALLDGPIEAQIVALPDESVVYVATLGGSLVALTRGGIRVWSVSLGGRAYGTPALADDGTIYVGSDARRFFAVSKAGQVKWKLETGADADTSAVVLATGEVVFASGSAVFAVRPSGDVAWRFAAKGKVFTSPAVTSEGLVVFGAQDAHVYALGPMGTLEWATDLGADVDGSPAIGDDGRIFVGTDGGEIVQLDARGRVLWRTRVGGFVRGGLSIARNGDVLAGVYGPVPREVRATSEGVLRGAFAVQGTGAREFGVHGGAFEDDDGTLVFGAQDDMVYAIGIDGREWWRVRTGGDVDAPVTLLTSGTLLVGSDDGYVYSLGPRTDAPPTK